MCYYIYLGIQMQHDAKELALSGIEIEDRVNAQLPALPQAFVWQSATVAGCSCSLFKKSDPERLERKYKANNWSMSKMNRALMNHLASTGLDPRLKNWIAGSATKKGPLYLIVNWVGEQITAEEVVISAVQLKASPGAVRCNTLFQVV
jgi:hypothetical protein